MSARTCPYCEGSGLSDHDAETAHTCLACHGTGIVGRAYLEDDAEVA